MTNQDRTILAIDLKSFYASVECLRRGFDPFKTPLVVADLSRGDGTIVLAASPFIREKYHVPSRCRLREVDKAIPGLIVARPHMQDYLETSAKVNSIYLDYVDERDMHIYSIDESFLDVTHYLKRNRDTAKSYARRIIATIRERLGLVVTCGIGRNLFMAKACMDIEAKKRKDFLAQWDYADIPEKLWPVSPLSKMWGVGRRLEKRLNAMGFYPTAPSSNVYQICSPSDPGVELTLYNGKTIRVTTENWSEDNLYIRKMYLNGKEWDKSYLTYADIKDGAEIHYVMSRRPDKRRATLEQALPPSLPDAMAYR